MPARARRLAATTDRDGCRTADRGGRDGASQDGHGPADDQHPDQERDDAAPAAALPARLRGVVEHRRCVPPRAFAAQMASPDSEVFIVPATGSLPGHAYRRKRSARPWAAPPEGRHPTCSLTADDDLTLLAARLKLGLPLQGFDGRDIPLRAASGECLAPIDAAEALLLVGGQPAALRRGRGLYRDRRRTRGRHRGGRLRGRRATGRRRGAGHRGPGERRRSRVGPGHAARTRARAT